MRTLCGVILLSVLLVPAFSQKNNAQSKGLTVSSKISEVTVYSDRAQVTRKGARQLTAGEHTLVFRKLPRAIEKSSVQVNGKGNALLKDVKFSIEHLVKTPDKKLQRLYSKKQRLEDKVRDLNDKMAHARNEKSFVEQIAAKVTGRAEKNTTLELDPDKWIKMVNFYRQKQDQLDKEIRDTERLTRAVQDTIAKVQQEIYDLGNTGNKSTNQVEVVVEVKKAGKISLELSYIVYGPSWVPVYDIRVSTEKKNLNLTYNAMIRQNTNEDWKNVGLKLSTAQAHIAGTQPELSPWHINFYQPRPPAARRSYGRAKKSARPSAAPMTQMYSADVMKEEMALAAPEPEMQVATAQVETKATSVVFAITGKNTILSDNEQHKVTVFLQDFDATFRYSAVPKLARYAYLKAKAKNETEYPLLAGKSNVFLDNNFVANSYLKMVAPTEEFWTFLGVDEGLKIDHKFIRKFEEKKGVISKRKKVVYEYLIKVANNRTTEEEVVIWDQLPIPGNKEIVVTLVKPKFNPDKPPKNLKINAHRYLEWLYTLKAGQEVEIPLVFTVEFPRNKNVSGL